MRRNKGSTRLIRSLVVLAALTFGAMGATFYYFRAAGAGDPSPSAGQQPATQERAVEAADSETDTPADQPGEPDDDGKAPVPVNVADVTLGSVSSYITSTANLIPENEVEVLAEAEGRVAALLVEEGDRVERGQLLVALARDDAEILYNKTQLKETNARLAYERAEKMVAESLISREDFDKINMDYQIARQELAEAEWKLDKTEIRAPFDGRITQRFVTLGEHIRPGDALFVVTDFEPLIARIYLPERDIVTLEEGREVSITLKADPSVRFRGKIRQISPVVDTATGTVKVTVEAIRPPSKARPGGFVTVDIVRETHSRAVLLPREAVIRELQSAHVFIANDGSAEKRAVELGLEEGDYMEALSGVEPGDHVVVAGQGSLKNGSRIKIVGEPSEPEAVTPGTSS